MQITVLRERQEGETRVALIPDSVKKLAAIEGVTLFVESQAGEHAGAEDEEYVAAGATVGDDVEQALAATDLLLCVNRPTPEHVAALKPGSILAGMFRPLDEPTALASAVEGKVTIFALELVPRITRAQSMDVLSSMATVIGYKAAVMAAEFLGRMFPLLMTAAGTSPPARVLVLGAGVAGLQAIATAKRLGAQVEGYDIRAAAGEQVRSLGAGFLEVDLEGIETEDAGGYATELTEEAQQRGRDLITKQAAVSDVIITTAQIPGRKAPLLLTKEAVMGMRPGSIVVDLAGLNGGNCELSKPGEEVRVKEVMVVTPLNLAATVAVDASLLYSRNMASFVEALLRNGLQDGRIVPDLEDSVLGPTCMAHDGKVVHERVAAAIASQKEGS